MKNHTTTSEAANAAFDAVIQNGGTRDAATAAFEAAFDKEVRERAWAAASPPLLNFLRLAAKMVQNREEKDPSATGATMVFRLSHCLEKAVEWSALVSTADHSAMVGISVDLFTPEWAYEYGAKAVLWANR